MESPVRQPVGEFICFAVFDDDQKLLYCKYNFDFDLYISEKSIGSDLSKNEVFNLFLDENETDILVSFSVKSELEKYFFPITEFIQKYFDYVNYVIGDFEYSPSGVPSFNKVLVMENEFNYGYEYLIYNTDYLYQFVFTESETNLIFSKYNFNFELYSQDFRVYGTESFVPFPDTVYGTKIVVFSDFIFRYATIQKLLYPEVKGYTDIPEMFRKYFYLDDESQVNLKVHLDKYSIFSTYTSVQQSFPNLNPQSYRIMLSEKYGIILDELFFVPYYYGFYGQFQQDEIVFGATGDPIINQLKYPTCSVITDDKFGSGMIYLWENAPDSEYYRNGRIILITTYHLISESNKDTLFANCYYNDNTNLKLMFRIIGYDKNMDICIAMYDETLDYNQTYFPEDLYQINNTILPFCLIEIRTNVIQSDGANVYIVGNPQLMDVSKLLIGRLINPNYSGTFTDQFILAAPTTIMTDIEITSGFSGSPIYSAVYSYFDDGSLPIISDVVWVGMVNAMTGENNQFSIGISGPLFNNAIQNGLTNYADNIRNKPDLDKRLIQLLSQDLLTKKWLGAVCTYFNPVVALNYNSAFRTFSYNGGVIIHKFILGFDTINGVFLYDYEDLGTNGVIRLNTPLLGTQLYQKYLYSNKTPIVIKSMAFFDKVRKVYDNFNFGKYSSQVSFDTFTYCLSQEAEVPISGDYVNKYINRYAPITITYYFFNGKFWVLESEVFGGNDDSWYEEYTDNSGYKFLQHRFEYPKSLLQYLQPFANTSEPYLSEDMPSDSQLVSKYSLSTTMGIPA